MWSGTSAVVETLMWFALAWLAPSFFIVAIQQPGNSYPHPCWLLLAMVFWMWKASFTLNWIGLVALSSTLVFSHLTWCCLSHWCSTMAVYPLLHVFFYSSMLPQHTTYHIGTGRPRLPVSTWGGDTSPWWSRVWFEASHRASWSAHSYHLHMGLRLVAASPLLLGFFFFQLLWWCGRSLQGGDGTNKW